MADRKASAIPPADGPFRQRAVLVAALACAALSQAGCDDPDRPAPPPADEAGPRPASAPAEPLADLPDAPGNPPRAYLHPGLGFGLTRPAGYRDATYPIGIRLANGDAVINAAFVPRPEMTPQAFVKQTRGALADGERAGDIRRRAGTLAGLPAQVVEFDVTGADGNITMNRLILAAQPGGLYVVAASAPADRAAACFRALDEVAAGFRPDARPHRDRPPATAAPPGAADDALPGYVCRELGFACNPPAGGWTRQEQFAENTVVWLPSDNTGMIQVTFMGPAAVTPAEAARRWEARRVKPGAALERRLSASEGAVNGYPAHAAAYEGEKICTLSVYLDCAGMMYRLTAGFYKKHAEGRSEVFDAMVRSFRALAPVSTRENAG